MTDKELLEFCKDHDVELSIRYDDDRNCYHLKLRKDSWWIEHILSTICIDDTKSWRVIVKSILKDLVNRLDRQIEKGENA